MVGPDMSPMGGKPPAPGAGDPGEAAGGPGAGGPVPSPMATPQPQEGVEKGARIQIQIASEMLQRELPHFPLESDEFEAVSKALATLSKAFGKSKDEDRKMFPAEIMNMVSAVGQPPSAGAKAMGGAPGGMPAGQPA